MICDPKIEVYCENCNTFEEFGMTPLAQRGSYDERNLRGDMKRAGWVIISDYETYCSQECADSARAPEE